MEQSIASSMQTSINIIFSLWVSQERKCTLLYFSGSIYAHNLLNQAFNLIGPVLYVNKVGLFWRMREVSKRSFLLELGYKLDTPSSKKRCEAHITKNNAIVLIY